MAVPATSTIATAESAKSTPTGNHRGSHNGSALNDQGLPVREDLSNLPPPRGQYPRDGGTRNAHLCSNSVLVQARAIDQPDRLKLIQRQVDPLELACRDPGRLVNRDDRLANYPALYRWSSHGKSVMNLRS